MSPPEDITATRTRPFATTIAAGGSEQAREEIDEASLPGPGSLVGVHYRLVRLLGEGNFGKVYVAERADVPEHRVAMKILPRSFYVGRNVERELVMLAKIGHPHVVQLMDHGMTADYVWLTMPVYEGETLSERLERGPLGTREAYDVFMPIALALEALHAAGLRHQDVKPENIFLARFAGKMHPVVLDLGVAAEKDGSFVAGTALYAAPEQLAAILNQDTEVPLSEKMDVYCFGATVLRSLVGERRFPGAKATTRRQVIDSHHARATAPIDDDALPELTDAPRSQLVRHLSLWMAIPPEDRPTMTEVTEQLDVLLEPERERARAEEIARMAQRRALARARIAAAIVLLGAVGLGGVALWKRETLRLAGELEEARARGAESFDKLDTCIASHSVAKRETQVCAADLTREKNEHEKTLSSLAKVNQGDGCSDVVEQLRDMRATMNHERKKHEDDLKAEHQTCVSDKERLVSECKTEKTKLEAERDTCQAEQKTQATEIDDLRASRDACLAVRPPGVGGVGPSPGVAPGSADDPYEPNPSGSPVAPPANNTSQPLPPTVPTSL